MPTKFPRIVLKEVPTTDSLSPERKDVIAVNPTTGSVEHRYMWHMHPPRRSVRQVVIQGTRYDAHWMN